MLDGIKKRIETDFVKIKKWFDSRLLSVNWNKTCYLPFTLYEDLLPDFDNLVVKIGSKEFIISGTLKTKYLGIIVDSHLRWNFQIAHLQQKLRGLLHRFRRLKCILDQTHLKIIYHSLVESQLYYGIIGWGGVRKNYLDHLEVLQRRFIKLIFNKSVLYPSDLLYEESGLFDVRMLYAKAVLVYLYGNIKMFDIITHNQFTRAKKQDKLVTFKMKKEIGKRYYLYIAPKLYNSLDDNSVMQVRSRGVFIRRIKAWLLTTKRQTIRLILDLDR